MATLAPISNRPAAKRMARMVVSLDPGETGTGTVSGAVVVGGAVVVSLDLGGTGAGGPGGTVVVSGATFDSCGAAWALGAVGRKYRMAAIANAAAIAATAVHKNQRRGADVAARGRAGE